MNLLIKTKCVFALILLAVQASKAQSAATISFEGQPSGTGRIGYNYSEAGFDFTSVTGNGFTRLGPGLSLFPQNGTAYLDASGLGSLSFVQGSGDLFSLNSVDFAEYSTVVPDAATVHFIGYHADGSTIEAYLTTDGIIGVSGTPDFQTFNFSGWNNLTRVDIPNSFWSLDNLVVTPAPEPGTLVLGAAGLAALLLATRLRRK